MSRKSYHVVANSAGGWSVRKEGADKAERVFSVKGAAISFARSVTRRTGGEIVIHSADGRIRDKNTYGRDPNPPKRSKG
jgi:hypothetical protein